MSEQPKTEQIQRLAIQRIYLKDVSFEIPSPVDLFQKRNWKPDMHVDINSKTNKLNEVDYEVILRVTTTVKEGDQVAFLIEAEQAGIFNIEGLSMSELDQCLKTDCLTVLYPYAREAISDIVRRATLPQLVLAPVNFNKLYAEHAAAKDKNKSKNH